MAKARKNKPRENAAAASRPAIPNDSIMNIGTYEEDDGNDKRSRGRLRRKLPKILRAVQYILGALTSTILTMATMAATLASLFIENAEQQCTIIKCGIGYLFVLRPLLSTLSVVCCDLHLGEAGNNNKPSKATKKKGDGAMTRIIAFAFLMSIVCNQFPKWLSAFVSCCAVFAFGLASRQLASHHQPQTTATAIGSQADHSAILTRGGESNKLERIWSRLGLKERTALGAIALVTALLIENFLIWIVSATYQPGIEGTPEALQDNGRIVLENLAMKVYNVSKPWMARNSLQSLRNGLSVQWALVSSLGASFVCLELQLGQQTNNTQQKHQRTLAGLAFHALMTLTSARIIRTISFVLTVLPSQVPKCYSKHFPVPPEEWGEWLLVGMLPNSRGGCNDLILSGHATVTSAIACAFTSAAGNTTFSIAVWTLIALDYSIESYQGLHYSVDMWLGCIVTCLLWQLTKPLEFANTQKDQLVQQHAKSGKKRSGETRQQSPPLDAKIVGMYAVPAVLAFIILTVFPEAYVNYFLLVYSGWVGIIFAQHGFTNFMQHILLCEMCFGLGAYL